MLSYIPLKAVLSLQSHCHCSVTALITFHLEEHFRPTEQSACSGTMVSVASAPQVNLVRRESWHHQVYVCVTKNTFESGQMKVYILSADPNPRVLALLSISSGLSELKFFKAVVWLLSIALNKLIYTKCLLVTD